MGGVRLSHMMVATTNGSPPDTLEEHRSDWDDLSLHQTTTHCAPKKHLDKLTLCLWHLKGLTLTNESISKNWGSSQLELFFISLALGLSSHWHGSSFNSANNNSLKGTFWKQSASSESSILRLFTSLAGQVLNTTHWSYDNKTSNSIDLLPNNCWELLDGYWFEQP